MQAKHIFEKKFNLPKVKKLCSAVMSTLIFMGAQTAFVPAVQADELDYIFTSSSTDTDTNILFVLDSSQSMNEPYLYIVALNDPATNPNAADVQALNAERTYLQSKLVNTSIIPPAMDYSYDEWHCPPEYASLIAEGVFAGCPVANSPRWFWRRIDIVRDVVRDTLPLLQGSNVGMMRTSLNNRSFVPYAEAGYPEGVNKRTAYPDTARESNGAYVIQDLSPIDSISDAQNMAARLDATYFFHPDGVTDFNAQTPLAESLFEAYKYYTGQSSIWTKAVSTGWPQYHLDNIDRAAYSSSNINGNYANQMTECSSNNIIVISDGLPTYDWHANSQIQALAGGSVTAPVPGPGVDEVEDVLPEHTLIDELSGYMANNDLDPNQTGEQNIVTHFISTWGSDSNTAGDTTEIIDAAVAASGGFHEKITDVTELQSAIQSLIGKIKAEKKPIIGYNLISSNASGTPFDRIDEVYINIWEYKNDRWAGNLKKFQILEDGSLVGKNNQPILTLQGLNQGTMSMWSDEVDGDDTLHGGAAAHLKAVGTNRFSVPKNKLNKNTYIRQAQYLLTPTNNQFNQNDVGAANNAERTANLNWAGGMDVYDVDGDNDVQEVRRSLGDQLNSPPLIAHYSNGQNSNPVVFTGSNEGYLHAFDTDDGEHLYSFMPFQLLQKSGSLTGQGEDKEYGIDGELVLWHKDVNSDFNFYETNGGIDTDEKLMLFFGLGRGGSAVYGLDISNRTNPSIAWYIDADMNGFSRLGETWGKVRPTFIKSSTTETRPIAIINAGLDPALRAGNAASPNLGNAIYILDAETGDRLWTISNSNADIVLPKMTNSIIGAPAIIDYNRDGLTDAFFVNDIRGQIFRCDFYLENNQTAMTCGNIANAQDSNENLLFMNSLDVSINKGAGNARSIVLSLSSGDRFNPTASTDRNRLVVFIDPYGSGKPANYNYVNGMPMSLSNITQVPNTGTLNSSAYQYGWYFYFDHPEEKSFAQTLTFDNKIFLSTHSPSSGSTGNSCSAVSLGTAKLYGFEILNGSTIKTDSGDASSHLLWEGEARGLPDTPYMVTDTQINALAGSLRLGVDDSSLDLMVDPVSRTYWLQSK
ncbi:MAG: hypothetical protein CMD81_14585 [Gammaproteobacteria bacterium]|nr:hypothetical protein [Gammaproteobacteria bacterium]|tara:strand:+ start:30411 stop:33686 length:3276 start_codon:yes stop_codon:yes gene_type:complete